MPEQNTPSNKELEYTDTVATEVWARYSSSPWGHKESDMTEARSQLSGKAPDDGKDSGKRRRGWQRMKWSDRITNSVAMNLRKLWETVEDKGA